MDVDDSQAKEHTHDLHTSQGEQEKGQVEKQPEGSESDKLVTGEQGNSRMGTGKGAGRK